jgi:hypothetical protein
MTFNYISGSVHGSVISCLVLIYFVLSYISLSAVYNAKCQRSLDHRKYGT